MDAPDFTADEWRRMHERDVFVKHTLTERLAGMMLENLELMAIIQELQDTLGELQEGAAIVTAQQMMSRDSGPEPGSIPE